VSELNRTAKRGDLVLGLEQLLAGKEEVVFAALEEQGRRAIEEDGADVLLIGSTTMSVISNPPVPTLAVRYGVKKRDRIQRIVVPVHLKQTSHAALDLAMSIARRRGVELHLVTLCEDSERSAAQALLENLTRSSEGVMIKTKILRGSDIEREIVRYAGKNDADVIFLNAEQQMGQPKIEIIRHAATPVMIVPAEKLKSEN